MKKLIFITILGASLSAQAQLNLNKIKQKVETKTATSTSATSSLSNDEIIKGLKEALSVGIKNAGASASALDGFNKSDFIRIPFPAEAQKMENSLRKVGFGSKVDEFEVALNRAAEEAAKEAAPLFLQAITSMSVNDGLSILKGEDDEATNYLKKVTSDSLYAVFKPIIQAALIKVNITKYWSPLADKYNKIPLTTKVNPDLEDYTTKKAMEGLFTLLAQEEKKIRDQPAARVTDILKKVFN